MPTAIAPPTPPQPFLKWTGSKRQLLPQLISRLPADIASRTYYEPFLGGGSLFWELLPAKAVLSDANADLINVYQQVRDNVDALIDRLCEHKLRHASGVLSDTYFYAMRSVFNQGKQSDLDRAATFIYLNKTGFNGLYRVNGSGGFNVPMGDYKNPLICDENSLRACNDALSHGWRNVTLKAGSYDLWDEIEPNSLHYLDPPYAPVSATSSFTGYGKGGFTAQDQLKLKEWCDRIDKAGELFMLSNSVAPLILDLYKDYQVEFVDTRRSMAADAEKRGVIQEVIVRNYAISKIM
jgi:DNA adenine methylase